MLSDRSGTQKDNRQASSSRRDPEEIAEDTGAAGDAGNPGGPAAGRLPLGAEDPVPERGKLCTL